jgi:hypothetical protein
MILMIRNLHTLPKVHGGGNFFRSWLARTQAAAFVLIFVPAFLLAAPAHAQQQPAPDPAKKDSPAPAQVSNALKPAPAKAHRVITNDDISTGPSAPVAAGARRRLKQLNRCDRACFVEVEKEALRLGYSTEFPRSTLREMEDRLANDIEELRNDPKWQQLLLDWISANINKCTQARNAPRTPEESPSHTPTRREILEEEERARNHRLPPGAEFNWPGNAVQAYRFHPWHDPLKTSFMAHQFMDELHQAQTCQVQDPPADADGEDP